MNDNEKFLNDNSMKAIDKKINEMGSDNLDGLESSLNHMDSDELRSEAKEMINDCSRNELQKVIKLLIKISRKSFEDE